MESLMSHSLLLLRYAHATAVLNRDDQYLMSGRTPVDILRATRMFLSNSVLWTSNAVARDENDEIVRPNSPRAVAWSVEGAIAMMSNTSAIFPLFFARLLDRIIHEKFSDLVGKYLDRGSAPTFGDFEAVFNYELAMRALDAAIEELARDSVHP